MLATIETSGSEVFKLMLKQYTKILHFEKVKLHTFNKKVSKTSEYFS
jgi:hypothetical protein